MTPQWFESVDGTAIVDATTGAPGDAVRHRADARP
jgi:hypothetical protein